MKRVFASFAVIISLVVLFALCFGMEFAGIHIAGFFAKERANIERDVFMNTRSYTSGQIQQLTRYRIQYIREKDEAGKAAIRSTVRMQFAEFPIDRLPTPELRDFMKECLNR